MPGFVAVSSISSASSSITRLWSGLLGSPMGLPKGKRTRATRGGSSTSASPLFIITNTVAMPSASNALAISPPDRLQMGQVAVMTTASTPSAFRSRATSGAVSFARISGSWMKPMKE